MEPVTFTTKLVISAFHSNGFQSFTYYSHFHGVSLYKPNENLAYPKTPSHKIRHFHHMDEHIHIISMVLLVPRSIRTFTVGILAQSNAVMCDIESWEFGYFKWNIWKRPALLHRHVCVVVVRSFRRVRCFTLCDVLDGIICYAICRAETILVNDLVRALFGIIAYGDYVQKYWHVRY